MYNEKFAIYAKYRGNNNLYGTFLISIFCPVLYCTCVLQIYGIWRTGQ